MIKVNLLLLILFFCLVGCSFNTVSFHSTPSGALISCGGEKIGLTPLTHSLYMKSAVREGNYIVLKDCKAQWFSGIETKKIDLKVKRYGHKEYVFDQNLSEARENIFDKSFMDALHQKNIDE